MKNNIIKNLAIALLLSQPIYSMNQEPENLLEVPSELPPEIGYENQELIGMPNPFSENNLEEENNLNENIDPETGIPIGVGDYTQKPIPFQDESKKTFDRTIKEENLEEVKPKTNQMKEKLNRIVAKMYKGLKSEASKKAVKKTLWVVKKLVIELKKQLEKTENQQKIKEIMNKLIEFIKGNFKKDMPPSYEEANSTPSDTNKPNSTNDVSPTEETQPVDAISSERNDNKLKEMYGTD